MILPHQIDVDFQFPRIRICHDCGEEIPCGLMNSIDHYDSCKRNAPNEDILSHYREVEIKRRQEQEEREFAPTWSKMSISEQLNLGCLSIGMQVGDTMLLSSRQMDKFLKFKEEMKLKYS